MPYAILIFFLIFLTLPARSTAAERDLTVLMRDSHSWEGTTLADVVRAATGHRVIPVDANAPWLDELEAAVRGCIDALNAPDHPVHEAGRVNEASRFIEDDLIRRIGGIPGWSCRIPPTAEGKAQRSGYPDLEIVTPDGTVIYLDPKLHHEDNATSSLRTFYFEPQTNTNKITRDAHHIILGVAHDSKDGKTVFTGWQIIDGAAIPLRLKVEFQSSNRDIYRPENTLRVSQ